MHLSLSSFLITLVYGCVLTGALQLLLTRKRAYHVFRIDFIAAFAVIVLVRMLLPVEFINTHTLASRTIVPAIYTILTSPLFGAITIGRLLTGIWLLGTLIGLTRLALRTRRLNRAAAHLPAAIIPAKYAVPRNVRIASMPGCASPFVCGVRHPQLVLPDIPMPPATLTSVLRHELQHIRNHDVAWKYALAMFVCVYWWFPPIYLLRRQVNLIIEMRVDQQVVRAGSGATDYAQSLVSITRVLQSQPAATYQPALAALLPQFTVFEGATLRERIEFMLAGRQVQRTNPLLLTLIVVAALLASAIIVEPDFSNYPEVQEQLTGTFELIPGRDFIYEHNGKYVLMIDGQSMGRIDKQSVHTKTLSKLDIVHK